MMKNTIKTLLFLISFVGMWSCGLGFSEEEVIAPIVTEVETTKAKLTTLESFWTVFQKAVADRDIETLESLFFPDVQTRKFGEKEYQDKIAAGKVSDIAESSSTHEENKVYYFMMTLPSEETGEDIEESATTIFFKKNAEGEFRIFNVLEAG